jgi:hypothetical protein
MTNIVQNVTPKKEPLLSLRRVVLGFTRDHLCTNDIFFEGFTVIQIVRILTNCFPHAL